jgi:hypothetical protein
MYSGSIPMVDGDPDISESMTVILDKPVEPDVLSGKVRNLIAAP